MCSVTGKYKIVGWGRMWISGQFMLHAFIMNLLANMRQNWKMTRLSVDKWNEIRRLISENWRSQEFLEQQAMISLFQIHQTSYLWRRRSNLSLALLPDSHHELKLPRLAFKTSSLHNCKYCHLSMILTIVGFFFLLLLAFIS